jgi:6-phosphofructokinase 1
MVPETATSIDDVIDILNQGWKRFKTSSIVVVAEEEELGGAQVISDMVKTNLPEMDIRVTTLGHIQRGGAPSAFDRILASRLGLGALEGLLNGEKNVMAGIINDQLVYTSFYDTINKVKPINPDLIKMVNILSV